MKKQLFFILACCIAILGMQAQTLTWTGAVNDLYNNANNWNPAQVPTAANDVIIPTGSTMTINVTASVMSITIQGTAIVNLNNSLTFTSPSSAAAASTVNWNAHGLSGGSTFTNNGTFNLPTTNNKSILGSTTFNNVGNFNITDSGDLLISDGVFNNQSSGVIDMQIAEGNISYSGNASRILNNSGLIKRTTTTGNARIHAILNNNNGVISVESGSLIFDSLDKNLTNGVYNVVAESHLQWASNTVLDGTLTGTLNGEIAWTDTVTINPSKTATFNFTGSNGVSWSTGSLTGGGTLVNKSLIFQSTTNNKSIVGLTTLSNEGHFNITDSGDLYISDGIFNNQASGVIDLQVNEGNISYSGGASRVLNNSGLIKRTTTGGTARILTVLNNTGTIRVETGNLVFDDLEKNLNGGTYNVYNETFLQWASNTVLTGTLTGVLDGEIAWVGTVTVADPNIATFDFTGNSGVSWSFGSLTGGGTLVNKSLIFQPTTNNKSIVGLTTLNNEGIFNITSSGDLLISDGIFNNQASGVIDLQVNEGNISYSGGNSRVLNNLGIIKKTNSTGMARIRTVLNNSGEIRVESGNLRFDSLDKNLTGGTYDVVSGSYLEWASNTVLAGVLTGVLNGEIAWTNTVTIPNTTTATFNFTGSNGVSWSAGSLTGGGTLVNKSLIFQPTTNNKSIVGLTTLNNEGIFNITSSGDLLISDGIFNNQVSGIIDLQVNEGNISYSGGNSHVLNNSGLIKRTTTEGTARVQTSLNNNNGTISVESGNLIFDSLDKNLTGGIYNVVLDSRLQWASNTVLDGTLTGTLNGEIAWTDTVTINPSKTATFNFTGSNGVSWSTGSLTGGGTLVNKSLIFQPTTNNKSIVGLTTLNNEGVFNITSSGDLLISDGIFNNQTTGVFDLQVDAGNINYSGSATRIFNNYGLLKKSAGSGTTFVNVETINFGTIDAQSGTMDFADHLSFTNHQDGVIKGVATVNIANSANYSNNGTYAPGASIGTLTFIGTYKSSPSSVLDVELNGLVQGTEYDLLAITGTNAIFEGTVNVELGFDANIGDSFTIATVSGVITTKNLVSPIYSVYGCKQLTFDVTYPNDNEVLLTVSDKGDVLPPDVVTQDITVQLDASGNISITPSQIDNGSTDNCTLPEDLIFALDRTDFTCADLGENTVALTVTDEAGNSASATAVVTVEDDLAPILSVQDITVQLDANGSVTISANDIDNGSSDNCTITSLSIDVDSFDCSDVGANTVNFTAEDQSGNSSTTSVTVTVEDNIAPTAVCQNITVQLDANGNATISAADIDNGSSDNCEIASMAIDTDTFDCSDVGENTVTLTVTDQSGNISTCTAVVTVEDSIAPIASCAVPFTLQLDANGSASITVSDIDNGSSDNCGIASATIDKDSFDCSDVGENTVTLTVTDLNGNVSTCTTIVTVEDSIAPIASCAAPFTVQLDAYGNASITVSDIDNGSSDSCGIASIAIDRDTFSCSDIGENTVTLTVTDSSGNISTCTTVVTVADPLGSCNEAPVAVCQSVTVNADANCQGNASALDFDGGSTDPQQAPLTFTVDPVGPYPLGTTQVTLTVSNGTSSDSCTTTITVVDNTPPVANCAAPFTVQLDAYGNASITESDIDDGSFDNCGIASIAIDREAFDCSDIGENTVTLTVTDSSGNVSTCTTVVTVEDSMAPTAITQDITVQLDANGNASITALDIDDGSFDNCDIASIAIDRDTFSCSDIGANTVTLTVTDTNGNFSAATATVVVEDPLQACDIVVPADNFITTWETTTPGETITIPTIGTGYYYSVDWGDGNTDAGKTGNASHAYATPGTYTVSISGSFPRIYFNNGGDRLKIKSIEQWGTNVWSSMNLAFTGCENLVSNATDTPDFSMVTDMYGMFAYARAFNGDANMGNWDVGNVTTMYGMFGGASVFNFDIGNWNVSNVTDMENMFFGATKFNKDIGNWNVGKVTNMINMFRTAMRFNRDIGNWNVENVTRMDFMFAHANRFNQNIGNWNVSNVTNMNNMFRAITLSTANYDALLNGWSTLALKNGVRFSGGNSNYCAGEAARQNMISSFNWTITDGGKDCTYPLDEKLESGENRSLAGIKLYPNPMADQLNLGNPKNVPLVRVSIFDMTGRLVQKVDLNGMTTGTVIDVSKLSSATYMVLITGESGQTTKLMIKE